MSNALYSASSFAALAQTGTAPAQTPATLPATAPAMDITAMDSFMLGLLAVGIVVLAAWIVRSVARPKRLKLLNTPGRPNRLTLAHIILVVVLMMLGSAAGVGLFGMVFDTAAATTQPATAPATTSASQPDQTQQIYHRLVQTASLLQFGIWLAAGLIVAGITFRHGLARGLGLSLRHWICDSGRAVVGYLAILPVCLGLLLLSNAISIWLGYPLESHPVLLHFRTMSPAWQVIAVINAVVLAPLAEEVFFRGLLQSYFRRMLHAPRLGIVMVSIVFAMIHAGAEPQAVPSLFALSLALGYNYERTGRLISPILIHAIFNAVSLLTLP